MAEVPGASHFSPDAESVRLTLLVRRGQAQTSGGNQRQLRAGTRRVPTDYRYAAPGGRLSVSPARRTTYL